MSERGHHVRCARWLIRLVYYRLKHRAPMRGVWFESGWLAGKHPLYADTHEAASDEGDQ